VTSRQSKRSSRAGPVAPANPLGVLRENTICLEARTADESAAFFLPYLTPGMSLLDCGCGPGAITVGIAKAAALGRVVGIDMHEPRLEQARALAAERSADNVSFQVASVYELPFEDNTFDAAFENSMLEHVNDPVIAAREIHRVLKPGGVFGARDVDNEGRLWGSLPPELNGLPDFLFALRSRQGSNLRIGKQLRGILRHAGFKNVVASASVESHGTTEAMMRLAERMVRVLEAPETRQTAFDHQLVDETTLKQWSVALRDWGAHPDSFHAFIRCEAVGWKK
jgi:ubiquinone/menaquinone biosynthesis C-methylase UbiE